MVTIILRPLYIALHKPLYRRVEVEGDVAVWLEML